ncbi:MAG: UDP-3-O-acyl-N-acetylglucosamine deacetylase [Deltaproteobacteria bacterium]|nr:UDP-3-O-acyl-N-acetylglucosamine deacetylase [Deltaproteobacteria bacterium]
MDFRQRTLKDYVSCTGIGLHSGEKVNLTIKPAPDNHGIMFVRKDLPGHPAIRARSENVVDTNLCTSIGKNGCRVSTVEHLMAALFGLGIDNVRIELDGPEVPIMDGSAAPFIFLLKNVGIKVQKALKRFILIKKPFRVSEGNRSVSVRPSSELKICYAIDFQHPLLRNQRYSMCFSAREFVHEISRARTFGFLKDIEILWENGLAKGGSLDNAIVIDEFRIVNEDGLRYKDEFVRHKILDFIGDLAILGAPVIGEFDVEKSGHLLNQHMLRTLMESKDYWETVTFKDREEYLRNNIRIPAFGSVEPVPA